MRSRCEIPTDTNYYRYGERGITVDPSWRGPDGFATFLRDMGSRPSPTHEIDRKDNDGPYSRENCRWATKAQQSRNRCNTVMLTHDGVTMCVADWADHLGMKRATLYKRLADGWDADRALTAPVRGT